MLILSAIILSINIQTVDADKEANKKIGSFLKFHDKILVKLSSESTHLEKINDRINALIDRTNGPETYQSFLGQQWRTAGTNICENEKYEHDPIRNIPPGEPAIIICPSFGFNFFIIQVKKLPEGSTLEQLKFIKERLKELNDATIFFNNRQNVINNEIVFTRNQINCLDFGNCDDEEFEPEKVKTKQRSLKFYEKQAPLLLQKLLDSHKEIREISQLTRDIHPPRATGH